MPAARQKPPGRPTVLRLLADRGPAGLAATVLIDRGYISSAICSNSSTIGWQSRTSSAWSMEGVSSTCGDCISPGQAARRWRRRWLRSEEDGEVESQGEARSEEGRSVSQTGGTRIARLIG